MGRVVATGDRAVRAPGDVARGALADYTTTRPAVLPEQYSEYRVDAGGRGAGTRVHWRLQATAKRVREQDVVVTEGPGGALVESDANSSMVTTWTVAAVDAAACTVRGRTTWTGAGGVGGFFELTFAPRGLARIQEAFLERLERAVATS